jgi:predicted nucleotidyltransferase
MLPEIFKTEERIRILRHISLRTSATVGAVALATGVSKGLVSGYLNLLVEEGLLRRENRAFIRDDSALWLAIKRLLNLDLLKDLIVLPAWAQGIGIYGSWARGTNTAESDLDLWILVDALDPGTEIRAAELEQAIALRIHCEVNALLLTPDKVRHLGEHDRPFYTGLKTGHLTLDGEDFATT